MKPQPQILTIWRVHLAILMAVPAFVNAFLFPSQGRIWVWLTVVWAVLFLALYLLYLPIRYRNLCFFIQDERIYIHSGVLYTRTKAVPLQNIQYTVVRRGPFERLFGLGSVVVTAAGGMAVMAGLRLADAEALSKTLADYK